MTTPLLPAPTPAISRGLSQHSGNKKRWVSLPIQFNREKKTMNTVFNLKNDPESIVFNTHDVFGLLTLIIRTIVTAQTGLVDAK